MPAALPRQLARVLYTEESRSPGSDVIRFGLSRRITHRNLLSVLIAGFSLVMVLLLAGAAVAIRNSRAIQSEAEQLVREQALTARLMNQMRVEQSTLNAVFYQLTRDPESIDRGDLIRQLDSAAETFSRLVATATGTPEVKLWRNLEQAAQSFSVEARNLIASNQLSDVSVRGLFKLHEQVVTVVRELADASSARAHQAELRINAEAHELVEESVGLLGGSLLLALICAVLTVRFATSLFQRMELQASELSRVSWHMLQGQEEAARRFSHELHDELGQSLTAVKAMLAALTPENFAVRRADCLELVDESIGNVRELSQLLRPVILDDFGLDAGLRWLSEKFSQRTNIQVDYRADLKERVSDETETQLFRIAQEALTNVARHSGATRVQIRLSRKDEKVWLTVADNGRGIRISDDIGRPSIGIIGMKARARHAGGDFIVHSSDGTGLSLEVWVPAVPSKENAAEESTDSVGR